MGGGLTALLCLAPLGVAAFLLARLLLTDRRLRRLAESMEDFLSRGGEPSPYSLREDAAAPVENAASELESRVVLLQEQLKEEGERSSRLTADISHQLKTPLASLRLFCELDAGPHLAGQLEQIERMEKLIGSLLRLEKLCADGYAFVFAEQPVRPLVEAAWEPLRSLWPEKRLRIEGDGLLRCDGKWLGEALGNVLKNACEHTGEQGRIMVRLERGEHSFTCSVEDDGGGVPQEELPCLFRRFYRAANQTGSGSGLGLAIAREIVCRHHGQIRAENAGRGLRVTMTIPVLSLTKT